MISKIVIHSCPRSGSTFLGEIINSSQTTKYCFQPLFSYELKDYLNENSSLVKINSFFEKLLTTKDVFINQAHQRKKGYLPTFKKEKKYSSIAYKEVRYHYILQNLAEKDPNVKFIFLIRNPVEVINSWVSVEKEFSPEWKISEEIIYASKKNMDKKENYFGVERWIKATQIFERLSNKYSKRILILNYKDLKNNCFETTKKIFKFCKLPYTKQTEDFLIRSTKTRYIKNDYSVFRGRAYKAKKYLSQEEIDIIKKIICNKNLSSYLV